jgi:hypothetical protein
MVFILSDDGRDEKFPAVKIAFERYENYLRQTKKSFLRVPTNLRPRIGSTTQVITARPMTRG